MTAFDAQAARERAEWVLTVLDPYAVLHPAETAGALARDVLALDAQVTALREALARAAYVAERLHAMIDRETWRATGGDDGQGHYEGDYRAELALEEIRSWSSLAAAPTPEDAPRKVLDGLIARAATEPLEVDISDYSDEWCAGFLAGQVNALEALHRAVPAPEEGAER